jgi:glycosyltransferase involved in cell wall biosynthesis
MPVYNAGEFLDVAVTSILQQDYTNFEFIIIDDASTDNSYNRLLTYTDSRIRLFRNHVNEGLIYTLNRCLDQSVGNFIARMDQDDISLPNRLSLQLDFMRKNPEIAVCGSFVKIIDSDVQIAHPQTHEEICVAFLEKNVFVHPSTFMRSDVILRGAFRYHSEYKSAEDYHFFYTISEKNKVANIPQVLLEYRIHKGQISSADNTTQQETARRVQILAIENLMGRKLSDQEQNIHIALMHEGHLDVPTIRLVRWGRQLIKKNKIVNRYNCELFDKFIDKKIRRTIKERYLWNIANPLAVFLSMFHPYVFPLLTLREWLKAFKSGIIKNKSKLRYE